MARYPVRCRHNACRHRRLSNTHPFEYKIVPKCPMCGHRKGWRIEHQAIDKRELCDCGGVMGRVRSVRHKTSHPDCIVHQDGARNQLLAQGHKEHELFDLLPLEMLGRKVKSDESCPF